MDTKNENQTVADLAVAGIKTRDLEGHPWALVPSDYNVEDLEQFLPDPLRIKTSVTLATIGGFISYVERFKENGTAIFAHPESGSVAAIIDYHEPEYPRWGTHRANFSPAKTVEWTRWNNANDKWLGQREFAEFIESNVEDITRPSGAEMLEIASTLEAKTAVDFKSGVRLDNGTQRLTFAAETVAKAGDKGTLDIPLVFELALAPFVGGEAYPLTARFRYKIADGKLTLRFQLVNPHKLLDAAIASTVEKIAAGTGIKPFLGSAP